MLRISAIEFLTGCHGLASVFLSNPEPHQAFITSRSRARTLCAGTPRCVAPKLGVRKERMYIPKHFEESNIDVLHEFIRCNPFATLITNSESGLCADHLPVYLNTENPERILLQGHIAAANPSDPWRLLPVREMTADGRRETGSPRGRRRAEWPRR